MNETITTIVGNLVDDPNRRRLDSGVSVTSFRVASTARRFDRATSHWVDNNTLYLKVTCWRNLADNTARSLMKGDPVVVTGRLYTRIYEVGDQRRAAYELEATALGFDLNRGVGTFKRLSSSQSATVDEVGVDGIPTGGAIDAHLDAAARAAREAAASSAEAAALELELAEDEADADAAERPPYGDDVFGSDDYEQAFAAEAESTPAAAS